MPQIYIELGLETHPRQGVVRIAFLLLITGSFLTALGALGATVLVMFPGRDFSGSVLAEWWLAVESNSAKILIYRQELLVIAGIFAAIYIGTSVARDEKATFAAKSRRAFLSRITYIATFILAILCWCGIGVAITQGPKGLILATLLAVTLLGLCGLGAATRIPLDALRAASLPLPASTESSPSILMRDPPKRGRHGSIGSRYATWW